MPDLTLNPVICGTGHRPTKLAKQGVAAYSPTQTKLLTRLCVEYLKANPVSKVISGMALGFDQALAMAAIELDIPFVAALPFRGQESKWPSPSQYTYRALVEKAQQVVYVSPGGYTASKLQQRNIWMVDHSDYVVALWDSQPHGGTYHCIKYAREKNKPTVNLFQDWLNVC